MAKKQTQMEPVEIDLQFPLEGVELSRSFVRQRPGTSVSAQNVVTFEPGSQRARGGARRGLTPYYPSSDTVVVNGFPIQDINHLITNDVSTPTSSFGQAIYARAAGSGFGLVDTTGTSVWTAGAVASFAMSCSCWDQAGNVYVSEINTATGAVQIFSYTAAGVQRWSNTSLGAATGSLRTIAGMCVIGTTLYLAYVQGGTTNGAIHQISTASGTVTLNNWLTQAMTNFSNLIFSTASFNCLAPCGTLLGIEVFGAAGNKQGFYIVDTTVSPATIAPIYTAWGGTAANNNSRVVTDNVATFYTISNTSAGMVRAIGKSGVLIWTSTAADTPSSIAFDLQTGVLAACMATGAANTVRQLKLTDGSIGIQAYPNSSIWNNIDSDDTGRFVLWRSGVASNDMMSINSTFATLWGPKTLANATHSGASVNPGVTIQPTLGSSRQIRGLLVANGECRRFDATQTYALTSGASFSRTAPVVFSAQNGQNMYYVDGVSYNYYKSTTDAITVWTATSGTMPVDPRGGRARLITNWRNRIVLAGLTGDLQNWFMSAVGTPTDWNYAPVTTSVSQAVSGTNSDAGVVQDIINCLIAYTDDTMIFGCENSIWQLTGDPANGGTLDAISHSLGMAWGRPYAIDTFGQIYFFGNRAGIYKMTPGALPVRISQQIEQLVNFIDFSQALVRMAWDIQFQGLWVWITPYDSSKPTQHYFWEERVNAWWPIVYANTKHNPLSVHPYNGDTPTDRVIMLGGRDGKIHTVSYTATDDDQTTITSSVYFGPVITPKQHSMYFMDMLTTLGASSGPVTFNVYLGNSPEAALASTPVVTGTWTAGRNHVIPIMRSGIACYVQVTAKNAWSLEKITLRFREQGKVIGRL